MQPLLSLKFEAIGTWWIIDILDNPKNITESKLLNNIKERIREFESSYSRFISNSLVSNISKSKGEFVLPQDAKELIHIYRELYILSKGKFTPLIGNVLEDAGYDSEYSLKPKKLNHPPSWDDALDYMHPKLVIKKPVLLDFGAAGKGYLVDIVGKILESIGIRSYCIDASGDILYKNRDEKLKVGLEDPSDIKKVIGIVNIKNESICGSSSNRRRWKEFHHIIDPTSLTSPKNILSTWVIAKNTIVADAIATCLFLTDANILKRSFDFEHLILLPDYGIKKSSGFPAELFVK